ncbi:hypothetical protein DICPUDRAFT_29118 [Dictyostelium purpureum]|uniref:Uncharacterized protein n=1 Tax=Dictyostelium purpureum TaxID=5786 RepID=F0ZD12_DICPU|nr:uncharacterized protein DICPUDRAFT_29118 [Dictyostelium purpureum]EGC38163.1 hypothetical protein DICPUDRAFT_29118 [Dictyostelium purpureum]|eukprot:XP_003285290.1 hypothetical protein DICPUDRAFT_29118 [Dictyostelium purpureum]
MSTPIVTNSININSFENGKIHYQFYKYIRNCQENRTWFYIKNFILTLIMLINEAVFFYNSLQFDITGCSINQNNNNNKSGVIHNNKFQNYTLSNCINYRVEYCIPSIYSASGDESLSFRVPLVSKYSRNLRIDDAIVITCSCLFLLVCLLISRIIRLQYIKRSRIQLLLTVNVLATKPRITREERLGLLGLCFGVVFYSSLKLWVINTINKDVSSIECYGQTVDLEFADKTSNSLVQSISNFFIFLYLFKDPILDIYHNITDIFSDLDLIDLVRYGDDEMIDHLKKIQTLPVQNVIEAVRIYIDQKYSDESKIKRKSRSNIFRAFAFTKNTEILEAINQYKLSHPHHFKSIFNNKSNENATNTHFINQYKNFNEEDFINNEDDSNNNNNNNNNNNSIDDDTSDDKDEEESLSSQENKKLLN